MKDQEGYKQEYTDWMVKTGGYAKDMTLRDYYAGLTFKGLLAYAAISGKHAPPDDELAREAYKVADAMLEGRAK